MALLTAFAAIVVRRGPERLTAARVARKIKRYGEPVTAYRWLMSLVLPALTFGQSPNPISDHNVQAWFMYFGDHKVSEHWGVHLEAQWRRSLVGSLFQQQLLIRPGINYYPSGNVMLTAGYAHVRTYLGGQFSAVNEFPEEHWIFEQAQLTQPLRRVRLTHRFRLEQRWIETVEPAGAPARIIRWRTQDRFRYMFRVDIPLKGRWSLGTYDELFLNYHGNVVPRVFDQNRAYVAVGHSTGKPGRLEVGYMNLILALPSGREVQVHTLQVAFYSTMPFAP